MKRSIQGTIATPITVKTAHSAKVIAMVVCTAARTLLSSRAP
jgi:hypothetical protein